MRVCALLGIAAIALIAAPLNATEWTELDPGISFSVEDVHFWDARTGIAVGTHGVILRTEDAGDTWSPLQDPLDSTHWFWSVSFADDLHGAVVGNTGAVFTTDDGGLSWTEQDSGVDVRLTGVCMVTPLAATVVGFQGTILKTMDGGATWNPQSSETSNNLSGVAFTDEAHGITVGSFTMLRTSDGGATWDPVSRPMENAWLFDVSFTDALHGRAVGDFTTILRTEDGGLTWTLEYSSDDDAEALLGVFTADAQNATAVGWFESGQYNVIRTMDGGVTWLPDPTGHDRSLHAVHHSPDLLIVAGGKILRADDGSTPKEKISWGSLRVRHDGR
jgi:photosystem II stability/assembly factor-like uncharacterized protein